MRNGRVGYGIVVVVTLLLNVKAHAVDKEALKAAKEKAESENKLEAIGLNYPYGPGDREMRFSIKFTGAESQANTRVWVVYGTNEDAITAATLDTGQPRGLATVSGLDAHGAGKATFMRYGHDSCLGKPHVAITD